MRTFLVVGFMVLVACGGATPPAADPASVSPASPPVPAAPPPTIAPEAPQAPARPADAASAAKAFFEAIAKHDSEAAEKVADRAIARKAMRDFGDVSEARFDGPAKPDAWPHLDDSSTAFEATLTHAGESSRVVVAVKTDPDLGWVVNGLRDLTAKAKAEAAAPKPQEAKGRLSTKPQKGSMQVEVSSGSPTVGAKAELLRMVDPSVPLVGGSWLVIADTEITKVEGKKVTLRVISEKSQMNVNGKKLDHFTPGVPIRLKWLASEQAAP